MASSLKTAKATAASCRRGPPTGLHTAQQPRPVVAGGATCASSVAAAAAAPAGRRAASRSAVVARAAAAQAGDDGVIDPMTGEVIEARSAKNPVAGLTVDVDGTRWAYRRSEVSPGADPKKPQVLCVHGLGSSSYAYRNVLAQLGAEGYDAVAPDLPGHGDSAAASPAGCTPEAYVRALDAFVRAAGLGRPLALVVQGYVTAQYALLWAQQHEQDVERLVILNTPLAVKSKLRPELAAFKPALPFLPKPKAFDAGTFAATGSPYAMAREDWEAYGRAEPFAAISATMERMGDFGALLKKVDEGFVTWRRPTVLLHGGDDPFLPLGAVFDFLENKRTCMQVATVGVKLGHAPQEDYPEVVTGEVLVPFLEGTWKANKAASPNAKRGSY